MFTIADKLGIGIYTPAEAAFYARVSRRMMSRWVLGIGGEPVIERQLRDSAEKVVTFLDFVQTLAVREVRNRWGVPLQRIRQGVDEARQHYGIEFPLACRHKIFLFGDRKEGRGQIIISRHNDDDSIGERSVRLTGRQGRNRIPKINQHAQLTTQKASPLTRTAALESRNRPASPIVEMFLEDLQFDPTTGLASEYSPMSEGEARIVLNPRRQFGEPIVDPGGYTAETLWDATNVEGGIEAAAEACGVTVGEVRLANRYLDTLLSSWAA
jgi:hypothetical protein